MIRLKIDDRQVQEEFRRLLAKSQNPEPAMAAISVTMQKEVRNNFRAEGRPEKWAALRPSTLAARAKAGTSGKILQASGHLVRSIMPFHTRTTAGVGTNVPYAAAQNFGSKPHLIKPKNKKALAFGGKVFKRVNHPGTRARPFMVLTDGGKEDLLHIMAMHIMSGT